MTDQPIVVKTTENTNTVQDLRDLRRPDGSWGWRRLMYFGVVGACLVLLGWVVFRRPMTDPVLLVHIRYSYYTLWLGLGLYGAQGTLGELAGVIAAFFSGKRIVETTAPPPASVTTSASGASKVETTPAAQSAMSVPDSPSYGAGQ
jgi:hypothetical protein